MANKSSFTLPGQGDTSIENLRENPVWTPPWDRQMPSDTLVRFFFELQQPPENPNNVPLWALRPRLLDETLWACLSGRDRDWQCVIEDTIGSTASPQLDNSFLHNQQPGQVQFMTNNRQQAIDKGKVEEDQHVEELAEERSTIHNPRRNAKRQKWSDEEIDALTDLMIAQRHSEEARGVPPQKWLKDEKLYAKMSRQLAERGIKRSLAACKNQWNRSARALSGFEERPDNGTIRAKICSEQKPKKERQLARKLNREAKGK